MTVESVLRMIDGELGILYALDKTRDDAAELYGQIHALERLRDRIKGAM